MNMKFAMLDERASRPTYAHQGDAGLDLYAIHYNVIYSGHAEKICTGIAVELPPGHYGKIELRSGLAFDNRLIQVSSGVIDPGYRGEIKVGILNAGNIAFRLQPGMRFAQLIIIPFTAVTLEEVDKLADTDRGNGGFGSTGK